ncbi:glycosyl hydrolase family 95 catalytic domain-containing protein, partial [Enterococcus faecium]|uniref:glycosyl hydrolase family 95 catalytic domain-containing protein n=1 Tax=Enterococcus faecium TaxID=1352 RepID=UPI0030C7F38E
MEEVRGIRGNSLVMRGNSGGRDGSEFRVVLSVHAKGGSVNTIGEHLLVNHADEVTLFLAAVTSFHHNDPESACVRAIEQTAQMEYDLLKKIHLKDYQELYSRVSVNLFDPSENQNYRLPTDQRLNRLKQGYEDNGLLALYFQ